MKRNKKNIFLSAVHASTTYKIQRSNNLNLAFLVLQVPLPFLLKYFSGYSKGITKYKENKEKPFGQIFMYSMRWHFCRLVMTKMSSYQSLDLKLWMSVFPWKWITCMTTHCGNHAWFPDWTTAKFKMELWNVYNLVIQGHSWATNACKWWKNRLEELRKWTWNNHASCEVCLWDTRLNTFDRFMSYMSA
jgi:hypothetical protein